MGESGNGRAVSADRQAVAHAAAVSAGMCVFALFVHSGLPLVIVSAAGLALAAVAVHLSLKAEPSLAAAFGLALADSGGSGDRMPAATVGSALTSGAPRGPPGNRASPASCPRNRPRNRLWNRRAWFVAAATVAGCALGVAFGAVTRWTSGRPPFPDALRAFAPLALLIGAAEEVLYRGLVQGRLRALGVFPAVVAAAACHTAYKCALFTFPPALPAAHVTLDFISLASTTFVAGLVLGAMRELARNAAPALGAHACFDLVVYGGLAKAPWWVWS